MPARYLLLFLLLLPGCKPGRKVSTSFYYWKTVYRQNSTENAYLKNLRANKLYVRIMDVDIAESGADAVPVSPVIFQDKLPDTIAIIPVVFIVNNVLRNMSKPTIHTLSGKVVRFVEAKVAQAGKHGFDELQIDCDWTRETRDNYFYLLGQLKVLLKGKKLSATLRLHQLKNQRGSGIPPVDRVLLMCYNMGNLRQYGTQNSILDVAEFKKYVGPNLSSYTVPVDVALPLFSWAVVFRDKRYIGIARQINFSILNHVNKFAYKQHNIYVALTNLPEYGLLKGDEVRWESSAIDDLQTVTRYMAGYMAGGDFNLIFFHLDEAVIKNYTTQQLENTGNILH